MKLALVFTLLASLAVLSFTAPVAVIPEGDFDAFDGSEDVELQGPDFVVANSDPAQYTFSDVHSSCSNIATIDAGDGWCTANGVSGFMVIDLKRVMNVEGVQTQARAGPHNQWVSAGEISYSVDGQRWENRVWPCSPCEMLSKHSHTFTGKVPVEL